MMNCLTIGSFSILLLGLSLAAAYGVEISLTERTVIQLADRELAARSLAEVDLFIRSLSPFDRAARMQTDQPVSQEEFIRFVSAQVLPWNEEEVRRMAAIVGSIRDKLAPYAPHLPPKILLVKTTGKEEGDAGYCRNSDVIVLPQSKVTGTPRNLENTLIHELFHILSRQDPDLRDVLYGIVGFQPSPGIDLPEALRLRKVTNPDAPVIEHAIEVTVDGQTVPAVPVLFASQANYEPASGKTFFAYLTFRLMAIERSGDRWQPKTADGQPQLLEVSEVSGFHDKIGRNTGYIIHPEEVLADNFVLLVNGSRDVPSPQIIERMRDVLSGP